ncbi:MAG: DNA helicase II [Methylococcaceae bacterium]|nr:DNA helicase II [Methylococcaceae bacterium]
MDVTFLIDSLNDTQRQAVTAPSKSMLILAGAGSGKTRVLVHRIVWQIQVEGLSPHSILAVTFTNKAAAEMRERIEKLLNIPTRAMWIGTFHGLAHRILRRHAQQAKLPDTFQILDSDDQLRVIKRLLKSMSIDDKKWPPRQVQWFINAQKDEGLRANHIADTGDYFVKQMLVLYKAYEDICNRSGLVDFAELLLRAHELLRDNPDLLHFYQRRFRQVHVDEFQDTNTIQYAWLRLLTEGQDNLFIVGDDDQSIYGWRGAKIANIFSFQKHYPNHEIIRLEQNYRSTGNILHAANKLIAHNSNRMGKQLWTDAGEGELISLYSAFNEQDEAYFVVERIKQWIEKDGLKQDVAILYRSNAQSRQFEERLMTAAIPYRVYGGLRFFERAEIKSSLAYLRLLSNRNDDPSFERVVNTPTRGIGAKTMDSLRDLARSEEISLWDASTALLKQDFFTARASNALKKFLQLINDLEFLCEELELFEKVKLVGEKCGLIELYKKEKDDRGEARIENLEELVNAARGFDYHADNEENLNELDMFLAHASLESGEMQGANSDDCIQLMTLHSAKGLEFKQVFMVGLEEGLFPSGQSVDDIARLEEERRLCYVGITRAMEQLYISYAESRRLYGKETYPSPSRFLREIPAEFTQDVRIRANITQPSAKKQSASLASQSTYRAGQKVSHPKFGTGLVLQIEGEGKQEKVQVNFNGGRKWLMAAYARLEIL